MVGVWHDVHACLSADCVWLGLSVGQVGGVLYVEGSNANATLTNVTITNISATSSSLAVVRLHAVWW